MCNSAHLHTLFTTWFICFPGSALISSLYNSAALILTWVCLQATWSMFFRMWTPDHPHQNPRPPQPLEEEETWVPWASTGSDIASAWPSCPHLRPTGLNQWVPTLSTCKHQLVTCRSRSPNVTQDMWFRRYEVEPKQHRTAPCNKEWYCSNCQGVPRKRKSEFNPKDFLGVCCAYRDAFSHYLPCSLYMWLIFKWQSSQNIQTGTHVGHTASFT